MREPLIDLHDRAVLAENDPATPNSSLSSLPGTATEIDPRAVETDDMLANTAFGSWLSAFSATLAAKDIGANLVQHFTADAYWRDILALTWGHRTFTHAEISDEVVPLLKAGGLRAIRAAANRTAPRLVRRSGRSVVEGYFDFEVDAGTGTGFVRLLYDAAGTTAPQAWLLLTTLQTLSTQPPIDERHHSYEFGGDNWLDHRKNELELVNGDPDVVIVGAGQSGLALAARLRQMGVRALLVERTSRIGDVWRQRYHSLTLHNETWANSLPYLPFPSNWPRFLPKDKLAGWLEHYAEAMELNVWTDTEVLSATRDDEISTWTVELVRAGTRRTVTVPHLVMATGTVSGVPRMPSIEGAETFRGRLLHSSQFESGEAYAGRHAVVFGTGNSGHDVAQDLHAAGAASVTIVQRSPTCVVSLEPSGTMVYALYSEHDAIEDIDLITAAIPYPVLRDSYQWLTSKTCNLDRKLLDGLHAVGFETEFEPDGTGFHMKYLRRGGGYYINVGCSDLIVSSEIGLLHSRDIRCLVADGLELTDGTVRPADLVVMATGFENQQEGVRRLLGNEVADRVGEIWGFDAQHELRNMWRRTPQPGFWVMGGNLLESRMHSRFLALQIKASLDGLLPPA